MYRWLYRTNQRWMKGSRSLTNLKSLANSCHNLSEWMYVWIPKTVLTQKEQGKTITLTTNLNQLNILVHRQSWQLDKSRTCSLTCLQQSTALPVGLTWQFLRTPLLERIALYLIESSTMCPRHTQPPHLACCPPGVMNQQLPNTTYPSKATISSMRTMLFLTPPWYESATPPDSRKDAWPSPNRLTHGVWQWSSRWGQ